MTYAVYVDKVGYIGGVTAPDRESAVDFLTGQGYKPGTYELREVIM